MDKQGQQPRRSRREFPATFLPNVARAADLAMTTVLLEDAGYLKKDTPDLEAWGNL